MGHIITAPRNKRKALYYVEIDGDTTGPFDEETLYDMVEECTILRDTLVWRTGMEDWIRADELDILSPLFPPEIIH